jgi:hypothetical protein
MKNECDRAPQSFAVLHSMDGDKKDLRESWLKNYLSFHAFHTPIDQRRGVKKEAIAKDVRRLLDEFAAVAYSILLLLPFKSSQICYHLSLFFRFRYVQ